MHELREPPSEKSIEAPAICQDNTDQLEDLNLVEYNGPDDPENPKNWSRAYKWTLMIILSGMSLTT